MSGEGEGKAKAGEMLTTAEDDLTGRERGAGRREEETRKQISSRRGGEGEKKLKQKEGQKSYLEK